MPLVHRPAAGTLSDANTAGIPAGAGRCIRPSPAGRRPPGQVPDCQAPASSAATAQARNRRRRPGLHPSPLVSRSIPQGGFQRGKSQYPPLRRFKKGPGGKHRVPATNQRSVEVIAPKEQERLLRRVAVGKGGAAEGVSRCPLGSGEGYGACDDATPPRIFLWGCGGVFFPNGKNTPPPAAGLRPLAALPPAGAAIPLSPSEAVISFHRMV